VHPHPFLKDAIATLPRWARPSFVSTGFVIELDPTGAPIRSLQDPDGVHVGGVTSVEERDGTLWLGSNDGDGVARVSLH
jgi:streptogramin lyase